MLGTNDDIVPIDREFGLQLGNEVAGSLYRPGEKGGEERRKQGNICKRKCFCDFSPVDIQRVGKCLKCKEGQPDRQPETIGIVGGVLECDQRNDGKDDNGAHQCFAFARGIIGSHQAFAACVVDQCYPYQQEWVAEIQIGIEPIGGKQEYAVSGSEKFTLIEYVGDNECQDEE